MNVYAASARSRTVFYTPVVQGNHKDFVNELRNLTKRVDVCIDQHLERGLIARNRPFAHVGLIVIDGADRLPATWLGSRSAGVAVLVHRRRGG